MLVFLRGFAPGPARAALKPHSARHGLGSKTVEQELTEGTEVLRYLCYLLFYEFGSGYAALLSSAETAPRTVRLCRPGHAPAAAGPTSPTSPRPTCYASI